LTGGQICTKTADPVSLLKETSELIPRTTRPQEDARHTQEPSKDNKSHFGKPRRARHSQRFLTKDGRDSGEKLRASSYKYTQNRVALFEATTYQGSLDRVATTCGPQPTTNLTSHDTQDEAYTSEQAITKPQLQSSRQHVPRCLRRALLIPRTRTCCPLSSINR